MLRSMFLILILILILMTVSLSGIDLKTLDTGIPNKEKILFMMDSGKDSLQSNTIESVIARNELAKKGDIGDSLGQAIVNIPNQATVGNVVSYGDFTTDPSATNTFLGVSAGYSNTGTSNTFTGQNAGLSTGSGSSNSFYGVSAGHSNTTGQNSCYMGLRSGYRNSIGDYNVCIGNYAGQGTSGASSYDGNVFLGYRAGYDVQTSGRYNVFIGYNAVNEVDYEGHNNTAIGANVDMPDLTSDSLVVLQDHTLFQMDFKENVRELTTENMVLNTQKGTMYVSMIDTVLYIASKYNSTNDIVYTFKNCGNNELFTFERVDLKANTSNYINTDVTRAVATNVIDQSGTDTFPSPITITGDGWGSAYLILGNHLNGAYKTGKTDSYSIYVNGIELVDGNKAYTNEVTIKTHNVGWSAPALPTRSEVVQEYITFNIINNTIGVTVEHDIDSTMVVNSWYGMQSQAATWQDSIYFAHSDSTHWRVRNDGINSGSFEDYPAVEKVMHKNSDRSIVMQMWMDNSFGVALDYATYISSLTGYNKVRVANSEKTYFDLIRNFSATAGDEYSFRGAYSWEDMSDLDDTGILASGMFHRGFKPIQYTDFRLAGTYEMPVNRVFSGQDMQIGFQDSSVNTNGRIGGANHNHYTTTGYGVIYETIDPSPLPTSEGQLVQQNLATPDNLTLTANETWYQIAFENTTDSEATGCIAYDSVGHCLYVKGSGKYTIILSGSFGVNSTDDFYLAIERNGVVEDYSQVRTQSKSVGDIKNIPLIVNPYLESGDCLKFVAKTLAGAGDVLSFYQYNLVVKKD